MKVRHSVNNLTLLFALALCVLQAACTRATRVPQSEQHIPAPRGAWAQERVGADLAREFIDSLPAGEAQPVQFAMFEAVDLFSFAPEALSPELQARRDGARDSSNNVHGTAVAQLIAGAPPVGGSSKAVLAAVGTHERESRFSNLISTENISEVVPQMIERGIRVLNMSHGYSQGLPGAIEPLERDRYSIIIEAAGNDYPNPAIVPLLENYIGVGNASVLGLIATSSSQGPEVELVAPSDQSLLSRTRHGDEVFSGTSGAAPQVTAAVINALSLIPRTTAAQMRQLLRKTAIPLPATQYPSRQNGVGMLNSYKLVRVAHRLKERGWPRGANRLLREAGIFDFSEEASREAAGADSIRALRRAYLLDPESQELRRRIAQKYRDLGDAVNAEAYELIGDFSIARLLSIKRRGFPADVADDMPRAVHSRPIEDLDAFVRERASASDSDAVGGLFDALSSGARSWRFQKIEPLLRRLAAEPAVLGRVLDLALSPGGAVDSSSIDLGLRWSQIARACAETTHDSLYGLCLDVFERRPGVPGASSVRECANQYLLSMARARGARHQERVLNLLEAMIRQLSPDDRTNVLQTFRQGIGIIFDPGPVSSAREELLRRF